MKYTVLVLVVLVSVLVSLNEACSGGSSTKNNNNNNSTRNRTTPPPKQQPAARRNKIFSFIPKVPRSQKKCVQDLGGMCLDPNSNAVDPRQHILKGQYDCSPLPLHCYVQRRKSPQ